VILYKPAPCWLITGANSPENYPNSFPDYKSVIRYLSGNPMLFKSIAIFAFGGDTDHE